MTDPHQHAPQGHPGLPLDFSYACRVCGLPHDLLLGDPKAELCPPCIEALTAETLARMGAPNGETWDPRADEGLAPSGPPAPGTPGPDEPDAAQRKEDALKGVLEDLSLALLDVHEYLRSCRAAGVPRQPGEAAVFGTVRAALATAGLDPEYLDDGPADGPG